MIPPGTILWLTDSNRLRSISTMGIRQDCRASSRRLTHRWMQICTGRVYSKRMSWSISRVLCRISCSQLMEWLVLHRLLLMIAVEQFISSVRSWQLYSPLQTNAYGKHCTISQRNRSAAQTIELSTGENRRRESLVFIETILAEINRRREHAASLRTSMRRHRRRQCSQTAQLGTYSIFSAHQIGHFVGQLQIPRMN